MNNVSNHAHHEDPKQILENFGGHENANFSDFFENDESPTEQISVSHYYNTEGMCKILSSNSAASKFLVGSLNIDSLRAKKDTHFFPAIQELANNNINFHAICIQESFLEFDSETGLALADFQLEGYGEPISQKKSCGQNGGLCIYLKEGLKHKQRPVHTL